METLTVHNDAGKEEENTGNAQEIGDTVEKKDLSRRVLDLIISYKNSGKAAEEEEDMEILTVRNDTGDTVETIEGETLKVRNDAGKTAKDIEIEEEENTDTDTHTHTHTGDTVETREGETLTVRNDAGKTAKEIEEEENTGDTVETREGETLKVRNYTRKTAKKKAQDIEIEEGNAQEIGDTVEGEGIETLTVKTSNDNIFNFKKHNNTNGVEMYYKHNDSYDIVNSSPMLKYKSNYIVFKNKNIIGNYKIKDIYYLNNILKEIFKKKCEIILLSKKNVNLIFVYDINIFTINKKMIQLENYLSINKQDYETVINYFKTLE